MAGESKGDNKLFQMIMVVITTIIAPVSVYFITHSLEVPTKPTPALTRTLSNPVGDATVTASPGLPLFTSTVELNRTAPVPTQSAAATQTPTLSGVQNPQGILPAGDRGVVNGMAVTVLTQEVQVNGKVASIQIHVRNQSNQPQTFSYRVQSITVKDGSGQMLDVIYGEKHNACSKKDLSLERKIELAPNQEIILQSVDADKDMNWCTAQEGNFLPLYQSSAKEAPKSIEIQFNAFGPFRGFGFKIDF